MYSVSVAPESIACLSGSVYRWWSPSPPFLPAFLMVFVGVLYGFFVAVICSEYITSRHHHVLQRQELTQVGSLSASGVTVGSAAGGPCPVKAP